MIEGIISGIINSLPAEQLKQIKGATLQIGQFMPIIQAYHDSVEKKDINGVKDLRVVYLLSFEGGGVVLYQSMLAQDVENKRVVLSRTLGKWDILEKIKELTDKI